MKPRPPRPQRPPRRPTLPKTYPGGKAGAGVYQAIINLIPAHGVYVEPFVGNGAVLRRKKYARQSIVLDKSDAVIEAWQRENFIPWLNVIHGDGIRWLEHEGPELPPDAVIYCDPPYMLATRSKRKIYEHEMTDAQHARLLAAIKRCPCRVIISGYRSKLYDRELNKWRHIDIRVQTRGGPRIERIWFNFDPDAQPRHDVTYAGKDYRARLRIKRKAARWVSNWRAMPALEREYIMAALVASAGDNAAGGVARSPRRRARIVKKGVARRQRHRRR